MAGPMGPLESPLRIRAHSLLCLQGYKGLGYSVEFVAQMDHVSEHLRANPDAQVQVITSADILCEHCPHFSEGRCTVDDPEGVPIPAGAPDESTLMDRRVLTWLDIAEDSVQDWASILQRIGSYVDSSALDPLCGDCRWREYPHCAEALDELHRKVISGAPLF